MKKQLGFIQKGGDICPRCGENHLKERLYTNALSRVVDCMICDSCGISEAIEDATGNHLPLTEWYFNKK